MNWLQILLTALLGVLLGWAIYFVLMRRFMRTNIQSLAMQGMSDGMLLISPNDRVDEVNDAALEILGLPRSRVENQKIGSLQYLNRFEAIVDRREEIQIGGNWYEFRSSPLYINKRRFFGRMILIHDINNRKNNELIQQAFLNDIQALQEIHLELSEVEDQNAMYIRMVELARERLKLDHISIFLLNIETNLLLGTYGVGDNGEIRDEKFYSEEIGEDHWTQEIIHSPKFTKIWAGQTLGGGWKAATALWDGQKIIGYMVSDSFITRREARPYEAELFAVLGSIYGHLIGSKKAERRIKLLNQRLEHMAMTDALTGLHNRRFFISRGTDEFQRCKRHDTPFSVIMFDIDHFKSVNDTFGHESGDVALIHTANVVRRSLREIDILCRTGGEEFSVLAINTDLPDAEKLAERLRKTLEQKSANLFEDRGLTISLGVAAFDPAMQSLDELLRNADMALYAAKKAGRNCVRSHQPA